MLNSELFQGLGKYIIAGGVVAGCFYVIATSPIGSDNTQPWSVITLIVGWLIRDSAGNSAAANIATIAASQPTVTTGGNPPRTTVTPPEPA
jgi:hypothetical protein